MLGLSVNKLEHLLNVFDIIISLVFMTSVYFVMHFGCHLFVSEYWIRDHELMLRARVRRRGREQHPTTPTAGVGVTTVTRLLLSQTECCCQQQ